jgi:cyanophycin synthetase
VALEQGINGDMITIYDRGAHIPLLWTHLIPATLEGKALHNVQNAMFAAAMAFSMGVRLEDIRHGLRTFDTTFFQAPGRLNVYDEHPFRVLFDYGHNAHAVEQLCQLANRLEVRGRRICVLSAPGDRRDEDIRAIATVAASAMFDHYICRRDDPLRGRGEDEVPRMLCETLVAHGVHDAKVSVIVDEQEAIDAALRMAERGDLLLVFADALARGWKQIVHFKPDVPAESHASSRPARTPRAPEPADDAAPPTVAAPDTGAQPAGGWVVQPRARLVAPTDEVAPSPAVVMAESVPPVIIPPVVVRSGEAPGDALVGGEALIRDARGVRLAPQAED